MEKVGSGNLSIEFKVEERKDEIGKLSNSFAKMISNLNGLIMSVNMLRMSQLTHLPMYPQKFRKRMLLFNKQMLFWTL